LSEREERPRRPRQSYAPRRRQCEFCTDRAKFIDYKNVYMLQTYVTEHGKIRPRRRTGACAKHQRLVAAAIKRARQLALLPQSHQHTRDYQR